MRAWGQGLWQPFKVNGPVSCEEQLPVGDPPLLQAAMPLGPSQPYDLLQGIVWLPSHCQQLVTRPQNSKQRCGNGMRAGHELRAHERCLCAHDLGHDLHSVSGHSAVYQAG